MPAIHSALLWSVKTPTLDWRFLKQQISWPAELRQQSCTIFLATQVSAAGRLQIISATCVKGATCSSRLKAYTPTLLTILMIRPFLDGLAQHANVQLAGLWQQSDELYNKEHAWLLCSLLCSLDDGSAAMSQHPLGSCKPQTHITATMYVGCCPYPVV